METIINDGTEYVYVQTTEESGAGQVLRIPFLHTKMSGTISDLLKQIGGPSNQEIPLTQVDAETMNTIMQYLAYHWEHPEEHENFSGITKGMEDIGEWDKAFITSMSSNLLYKVTMAANYLAITDLLMLCCKQHAMNIKDMTPKEKKAYLGITETYVRPPRQNCFTCGQSNRMECQWCIKCGSCPTEESVVSGEKDSQSDFLNNNNNDVTPMDESE